MTVAVSVMATIAVAAPAALVSAQPIRTGGYSANLSSVSVAPRSATAFAIGTRQSRSGLATQYAVRRRHGHWRMVPLGVPDRGHIEAVAAGSAKAAWAVGNVAQGETSVPLIEYSTGKGFHRQEVPQRDHGALIAVAASSAKNAWAVGTASGLVLQTPYVVHWNGNRWATLDTRRIAGTYFLSVTTTGAHDVWFLGGRDGHDEVVRWNGSSFDVYRLPLPRGSAADNTILSGITAAGPREAWTVGYTWPTTSGRRITFADHWNGRRWKLVPVPSPSFETAANSITAAGHRVYLGGALTTKTGGGSSAFVMRYIDGAWRRVSLPDPHKQTVLEQLSVSTKSGALVGLRRRRTGDSFRETVLVDNLVRHNWRRGTIG